MNILITICARGGSKGIPGKNIKLLNGKPLIEYTIGSALDFAKKYNSKVALSTDDENILSKFDIVIASIHSNLKMTEDKAMLRLMNAIENPYTSVLGHMTGRLLLSRNGYPIDHKKIIEACAANDVVIELNAHPRRLDIDWRWINYALKKNVLISINPDAHSIDGFNDCKYGVLVAQKAGLTKEQNLSSFKLTEFESFLVRQHQKRG